MTVDTVTLHCLGHVAPAGRAGQGCVCCGSAAAGGLSAFPKTLHVCRPAWGHHATPLSLLPWQRAPGGGRPRDNTALEDPHITSADKAEGGMDIGPLGGGEGRAPPRSRKETLERCHLEVWWSRRQFPCQSERRKKPGHRSEERRAGRASAPRDGRSHA